MARPLFIVLAVLALGVAVSAGCGGVPPAPAAVRDQEPSSDGSWSFAAAGPSQAVVWSWGDVRASGARQVSGSSGPKGEAVTWLWASRRLDRVVRFEGPGAYLGAGSPAAAFAVRPIARDRATSECLLVSPSAGTRRVGTVEGERVSVVWAGGSRALVMSYAGRRAALTLLGPGGPRTLRIGTPGQVATCQASADGRRAVVGEALGGGRYRLDWIVVTGRGGPHIVARTSGRHPVATLDPAGRLAVLIGSRPQLVRFGRSAGRRLPAAFASAAQVGGGRVLLQTAVDGSGAPGTRLRVCTVGGRVLWSREVPAVVRAHADPRLRWISYADPASGSGVVTEVASGRAARLDGCDDVFPVSAREAATVSPGGVIAYRAVPW